MVGETNKTKQINGFLSLQLELRLELGFRLRLTKSKIMFFAKQKVLYFPDIYRVSQKEWGFRHFRYSLIFSAS
jgi:hypothetical protein